MPNDAARRADALTQTVLTLAKEVWTLRDRQLVLEAVLQERGIDVTQAVDRFQPSGALKQRLADERRLFLADIVDALSSPPKP
jgi:hypothetical protein